MLLPSTHSAVLLLLALALVCLGSWATTCKLAGPRWRFELFYFDFAFGALAAAAILAWTVGTLGSELSFADRIAVAGLRSQAMAMGGGFLFSLGNVLLLASVSLLGLAAAFPLAGAMALMVGSVSGFEGISFAWLAAGDLLLIGCVFTAIASRREASKGQPAAAGKRPAKVPQAMQRRTKGAIAGILGGLFIGASYVIANGAFWGDLGLGAYAGLLLFAVGLLISTVVFGLFFLNIAIEGSRLSLGSYFQGGFRQHALGLTGGIVWAVGMAGWLLAQSAPENEQPASRLLLWALQGSALLAMLWGVLVWREFQGRAAASKRLIAVTAILYLAGLAGLGLRFR